MAHQIATSSSNRAAMAYVGALPWHGLGQSLTAGASIETWKREAGMDFTIDNAVVEYRAGERSMTFGNKRVFYRSDSGLPLAVNSDRYQIVQPGDVLEFFRDLCNEHGFTLETAGVLYDGARYWALAKVPMDFALPGEDRVGAYVLLATSCDGSLATTAQFTATRVVCNNTLSISIHAGERGAEKAIRVKHSTEFRATKVKVDLGILTSGWDTFAENAKAMAARRLSPREAVNVLIKAMGDPAKSVEDQPNARPMARILELWNGGAIGSDLSSSQGTAWGLLNAATEHFDHHAGHSANTRLASAWFGKAATTKVAVYDSLLDQMIAEGAANPLAAIIAATPEPSESFLADVLANTVQ